MCTSAINTWIYACRHHYWNIQCCDLTVFQPNFTTFLIETGYEEPIKITDKMLKSDMQDGSFDRYKDFFYRFSWISVISSSQRICYRSPSLLMCRMGNRLCAVGVWTDDNHRFLLCEMEDRVFGNRDNFVVKSKGSPTLKYINDVIDHVEEAGIYKQFKKRCVSTVKLAKSQNISQTVYWYIYINVKHMQVPFCILLLGYEMAVVCMVKGITWYHMASEGRVA